MKSIKKDTQTALYELLTQTINNAKQKEVDTKKDILVGIQKYHKSYIIIVIENKRKNKRVMSSYVINANQVTLMPTNIQDLDIFYTDDEVKHGKNLKNGKPITKMNIDFELHPNWIKKQINKLRSKFTKLT
jgi:hypothetical protein